MFFFEDFFKVAVFVQFRYRQKYQLVVVPDQHTSGWFKEVLSLCCYSSREPLPVSLQREERVWSHFA